MRPSSGVAVRSRLRALAGAVAVAMLCSFRSADAAPAQDMPVAGWLERARLSPGDVMLEAKLDSGARTSALHVEKLEQFERNGQKWTAFEVTGEDGRTVRIERPLVRISRVRSALGIDPGRLTVTLGICVGNVYRVTEVSLVDRSGLAKPLLIGRRFLEGRLLVDSSRTNQLAPECGGAAPGS